MYAYPQRPGAVAPAPPTVYGQPPVAAPQPAGPLYVPSLPAVADASGLFSASSGSVTTLRLKLAEDIRIDRPVEVSAALLPSSTPQAAPLVDLALERQLTEGEGQTGQSGDGDAAGGSGSSGGIQGDMDTFLSGIKAGELPQDPAVKKVVAMGVPEAPAALAVIYSRAGRGGSEKAADFGSKCEQLTGMGFSLALAAGALAKHTGDVEAATESCLAIAS